MPRVGGLIRRGGGIVKFEYENSLEFNMKSNEATLPECIPKRVDDALFSKRTCFAKFLVAFVLYPF